MNKFIAIAGIKDSDFAWHLMGHYVSKLYTTDGFSYVALGENGLFGERWEKVSEVWNRPAPPPEELIEHLRAEIEYEYFGDVSPSIFAFIAHSESKFPLMNGDIALVHDSYKVTVLKSYLDDRVREDLKNIQTSEIKSDTFAALSAEYLDLLRHGGDLSVSRIDDMLIWATHKDHIRDVAAKMSKTVRGSWLLAPDRAVRLDVKTGRIVEKFVIEPTSSRYRSVHPSTAKDKFDKLLEEVTGKVAASSEEKEEIEFAFSELKERWPTVPVELKTDDQGNKSITLTFNKKNVVSAVGPSWLEALDAIDHQLPKREKGVGRTTSTLTEDITETCREMERVVELRWPGSAAKAWLSKDGKYIEAQLAGKTFLKHATTWGEVLSELESEMKVQFGHVVSG